MEKGNYEQLPPEEVKEFEEEYLTVDERKESAIRETEHEIEDIPKGSGVNIPSSGVEIFAPEGPEDITSPYKEAPAQTPEHTLESDKDVAQNSEFWKEAQRELLIPLFRGHLRNITETVDRLRISQETLKKIIFSSDELKEAVERGLIFHLAHGTPKIAIEIMDYLNISEDVLSFPRIQQAAEEGLGHDLSFGDYDSAVSVVNRFRISEEVVITIVEKELGGFPKSVERAYKALGIDRKNEMIDSASRRQQAIGAFKEILGELKAANNFNILEVGLKNADKGYSYSRDGSIAGFKEMDPNSLRSKLLQITARQELIDKFDAVMIELSESGSIPWEELQEAFHEETSKRF